MHPCCRMRASRQLAAMYLNQKHSWIWSSVGCHATHRRRATSTTWAHQYKNLRLHKPSPLSPHQPRVLDAPALGDQGCMFSRALKGRPGVWGGVVGGGPDTPLRLPIPPGPTPLLLLLIPLPAPERCLGGARRSEPPWSVPTGSASPLPAETTDLPIKTSTPCEVGGTRWWGTGVGGRCWGEGLAGRVEAWLDVFRGPMCGPVWKESCPSSSCVFFPLWGE